MVLPIVYMALHVSNTMEEYVGLGECVPMPYICVYCSAWQCLYMYYSSEHGQLTSTHSIAAQRITDHAVSLCMCTRILQPDKVK